MVDASVICWGPLLLFAAFWALFGIAWAAIGLGSVFTHLKAEVNWHRLFHDLIDDFDEQTLEDRQKKALNDFDIPFPD